MPGGSRTVRCLLVRVPGERRKEKAACSDVRIQPRRQKAYLIQYWLAPMAQFLKIGQVQPDSISKLATLNTRSAMRILRGEGVFNVVP